MTWIIVSVLIGLGMLVGFAAIGVQDFREREAADARRRARTSTRPVNEGEPGDRCAVCGQLPILQDEDTFLWKCDDGEMRCGRCR